MMQEYVKEAIEDFLKDILSGATTPATNSLLEVNPDSEFLLQQRVEIFTS